MFPLCFLWLYLSQYLLASLTTSSYPYDPVPQVCAPPLIWMCIAHAYSQGHLRLNSDIASYNMSGVDVDGCWWVPPGMGLQVTEGVMFIAAL